MDVGVVVQKTHAEEFKTELGMGLQFNSNV